MASTKTSQIDAQLKQHIIPVLCEWGMAPHPSRMSEFGRYENGFLYQFADARDSYNVKLCDVHIFRKDMSVKLEGAKGISVSKIGSEIPMIGADIIKSRFVLTRPSNIVSLICNKFDLSFRLKKNTDEDIESAVSRLIFDVLHEMPRLKKYLYG